MSDAPSDDELSAILAALDALTAAPPLRNAAGLSAWTLAARLPDLEIDDLLALGRAPDVAVCSARY
ncbi:MAG TPA: hypothetical protein VIJ77_04810 [Candidatus Tumulicola sp.]